MIILIIIAIVCFMIAIKLRNEQGGWFSSDNNSSYVKSILRHSGVALRYFCEFTLPDGRIIDGCSVNTIAYKTSLSFLKENHIL